MGPINAALKIAKMAAAQVSAAAGFVALYFDATSGLPSMKDSSGNVALLFAGGRGIASGTSNASGIVTVTHGLGVAPTVWQAWTSNAGSAAAQNYFIPTSSTTTTVTFTMRGSGGALQASAAYALQWVAYL